MIYTLIIACVYFLCNVQTNEVDFITKCVWDDLECQKKATIEVLPKLIGGFPQYRIDPLDPLLIDYVDASTPDLEFKVRNIVLTGLYSCVPVKMTRNKENSRIYVDVLCTVDIHADYEMNGKLTGLNLKGNGKMTATLRKLMISAVINMYEKEKYGEKYWALKSWSHTFVLKDKSDISFTGLVPNNNEMQGTIDDFLRDHSNEVITDLAPKIIEATCEKVLENVHNLFINVPIDELITS